MKMTSFAMILMTGAVLSACGDTATKTENSPSITSKTVPNPAAAQESDNVSVLYKNGITDANRGDKTGLVRLHGTINQPSGGEVTLYETEGRNTIEVAKTRLSNRAFDFGEIEVSRGF